MWRAITFVLAANILLGVGPTPMDLLDNTLPLAKGETFAYSVLEDNDIEPTAVYIGSDGGAEIPLLGRRKVAGYTPKVLAETIKKELEKKYYYTATVIIDRKLPETMGKVFLSGQVAKTGSIDLLPSEAWTLSKTILSAGGFLDNADKSKVALIRKNPADPSSDIRVEFDVGKMLETGDFSNDPIVQPSDTIFVPRLDMTARVTVSGEVNKPGIYNIIRSDFTVSQAVLAAGGLGQYANEKKVKLIRQQKDGKTITKIIDLKKVLEDGRRDMDPILQPDDTISVPERFINF